jgi:flagellar motor switch protein FliM
VRDANEHVVIRTQNGTLLVDVDSHGETVHVVCPLSTIEHISEEIAHAPSSDSSIAD